VIPDPRDRDVYLCGGGAMIRDAIAVLTRLGCDPARCFTEAWY
jgi:ferredoxin-NADP reductase